MARGYDHVEKIVREGDNATAKPENWIEEGRRIRDPESEVRALAYARDTRTKFERVYESARKAVAAGDTKTAILKCRAALDLLKEKDIYGAQQAALVQQIQDLIGRLSMK